MKKRMGATNVGVRRAHPYLWSLSSPQQPLETEDSPAVSSCPTIYLATRVPCKTQFVYNDEVTSLLVVLWSMGFVGERRATLRVQHRVDFSTSKRKNFTPSLCSHREFAVSRWLILPRGCRFLSEFFLQSLFVPEVRFPSNEGAVFLQIPVRVQLHSRQPGQQEFPKMVA